jgi:hypothetical protein
VEGNDAALFQRGDHVPRCHHPRRAVCDGDCERVRQHRT